MIRGRVEFECFGTYVPVCVCVCLQDRVMMPSVIHCEAQRTYVGVGQEGGGLDRCHCKQENK